MTSIPRLSFSLMAIYVASLARKEDFYTRVLGFAGTDRGGLGALTNPINQAAFRLAELAGR